MTYSRSRCRCRFYHLHGQLFTWIVTHDVITSLRMLKGIINTTYDVRHDVKFDAKESREGRVQITDNVAEQGDREDSDDTHDEFHPVRLRLQQQNAEKTEEPQTFQEHPSAMRRES